MHCFMKGFRIRLVSIALVFSLLPGIALSLGFGSIKLFSYLNEPLDAEIELAGAEDINPSQLTVSLASAEDFKKIDMARPYFLTKLRFQVIRKHDRAFIQVTSDEVVKQPVLEFLIEMNWANGRLVRGYTLLLDPAPLGGVLKRKREPAAVQFNDSTERKRSNKLSENLITIKPKQVAMVGNTIELKPPIESKKSVSDPNIQNLEALFDADSNAEWNAGLLATLLPLESEPAVAIDTTEEDEKEQEIISAPVSNPVVSSKPEASKTIEANPILPSVERKETFSLREGLYENKLLLGSTLALMFVIALTVWILKRARESLSFLSLMSKPIDPLAGTSLVDEEITIKFELAANYIAIEDYPSARAILEDIRSQGNQRESDEAILLLNKLPT